MAQLVALWLVVWVIIALCMTQLIDCGDGVYFDPIMNEYHVNEPQVQGSASTDSRWTSSYTEMSRDDKKHLKYFKNINKEGCDDKNLESEREMLGISSTVFTLAGYTDAFESAMRDENSLAKSSLKHYLKVCGLEKSYRKLVKQSASNAATEPSLYIELMNNYDDDDISDKLLWAIKLVRDPKFPSAEIKCSDEGYVEKIADGFGKEYVKQLNNYAEELFEKYLLKCGHEDRFQKIASEFLIGRAFRDINLYDYLTTPETVSSGHMIVRMIEFVDHLASIKETDGQNCEQLSRTKDLLRDVQQNLYNADYPKLISYAGRILERNLSACGK